MAKKTKSPVYEVRRNPVAHHAHKVNKSTAFQDRTRYRRTAKHKGMEPFANRLFSVEADLRKISA